MQALRMVVPMTCDDTSFYASSPCISQCLAIKYGPSFDAAALNSLVEECSSLVHSEGVEMPVAGLSLRLLVTLIEKMPEAVAGPIIEKVRGDGILYIGWQRNAMPNQSR